MPKKRKSFFCLFIIFVYEHTVVCQLITGELYILINQRLTDMDQLVKLRTQPVSALMQKDFHTIKGSCTVAEAIQLMKKHNQSGLVVEPRNEDDCYGVVTEKDILEKVIDPGEDVHRDPWNTPVFQIMSKPVISINPSLRIKYALRLMKRTNVRRLTVMDHDKVVGVLNMSDVLHAVEELPAHDDNIAL